MNPETASDHAVLAGLKPAGFEDRLFARIVDFNLLLLICSPLFLGCFFLIFVGREIVVPLLVVAFHSIFFLLEAILYAKFGNTLGKWMFGIRVLDRSGAKMTADDYGVRCLAMLRSGFWWGILFVSWIPAVVQCWRVLRGRPTSYDAKLGSLPVVAEQPAARKFFGDILVVFLVLGDIAVAAVLFAHVTMF